MAQRIYIIFLFESQSTCTSPYWLLERQLVLKIKNLSEKLPMDFSEKDKTDTKKIGTILSQIDNMDGNIANRITDEIYQYQPFLISQMLGYRLDTQPEQTEDIIKIILLIWEFFKNCNGIKNTNLTQYKYEKMVKRNINLLMYLDGESSAAERQYVTSSDLSNLRSKALLAEIFYRFENQKSLLEMNIEAKGATLIGMKSLIECFEEIENNHI